MANPKVEVLIEAVGKNFDKVIGQVNKLDDSIEKVGSKGLGTGFATDLMSSLNLLSTIGAAAGTVWAATAGEFAKYGEQVEKLSLITGQSAEITSRQIQLADDLGVSYASLTTSLRAATKSGIDTSIEGLVRLGEQYKALAPGMERAKFLTDKFGASGSEMGKILEKTGAQIREIAESTPDGLILSDKDIDALDEYNRSLSDFQDNLDSLKIKIGRELIPLVNDWLTQLNNQERLEARITELRRQGIGPAEAGRRALEELKNETAQTEDATRGLGDAAEDTGESLEDMGKRAEATAKRMSGLYKDISKGAFDIMKSNRDYADSLDDLVQSEADTAQKRKDIEYDLYEFRQEMAAKIAEAESAKEKQKLLDEQAKKEQDYYRQLEDNEKDMQALGEKRLEVDQKKLEADAQKKYNLLEQRALIDGIITSGENEWLMEQAVNLGLITPAARDAAIAQSQWADAMYASFAKTQPGMEETLRLMQEMYAYDGKTVNFGVNFQSNRPSYSGGYSATSTTIGSGVSNSQAAAAEFMSNLLNNNPGWRDSGGLGFAGQPYMIGTGAQPEMFVPNSNGTFIPNADKFMGTTYNIVINNPKRETAENSIRTSLKKLSYTGVAQ